MSSFIVFRAEKIEAHGLNRKFIKVYVCFTKTTVSSDQTEFLIELKLSDPQPIFQTEER